jgi:hypothetical protein
MACPGPECPMAVLWAQLFDHTQLPEDPLAAVNVLKLVENELDIKILCENAKFETQRNIEICISCFIIYINKDNKIILILQRWRRYYAMGCFAE